MEAVVFIGEKWSVTPSTSGKRAYKSVAIITTYLVNRDGNPHIFETTHQAASQLFPKQLNWLVVLTILKNISQWKGLSHILWKIKNVPNNQPGLRSITRGFPHRLTFATNDTHSLFFTSQTAKQ
jgi:hypothetical protein